MSATRSFEETQIKLQEFFDETRIPLNISQINELLEYAVKTHPEHLLSETDRAWLRMKALHNLLTSEATYESYKDSQPDDECLSKASYEELKAQMLSNTDPVNIAAEIVMIMMDALKGAEIVKEKHTDPKNPLPTDTVQFFFATGQNVQKYYPELDLNDAVAERIRAYTATPTHFRHFFFGEGPASGILKQLLMSDLPTDQLKVAIQGLDAFWRNNMLGFHKPSEDSMGATWKESEYQAHKKLIQMLYEYADARDPALLIEAADTFYLEQATVAGTDLSSIPAEAQGYFSRTLLLINAIEDFPAASMPSDLHEQLKNVATKESRLFAQTAFQGVSHLPVLAKELRKRADGDEALFFKTYLNIYEQILSWGLKQEELASIPLFNLANCQGKLLDTFIRQTKAGIDMPALKFGISEGKFASLMIINCDAVIEANIKLVDASDDAPAIASPTVWAPDPTTPRTASEGGAAGGAPSEPTA